MALLSLIDATLGYGGHPLLDGVEFHIERGERICLLGSNGAGKSSMLRVLAGETPPDRGQVVSSPGLRIGRLPQQVPTHLRGRVLDIVAPGDDAAPHGPGELDARQMISRLKLDAEADFAALSGGTRRRVLLARTLMGRPDLVLLDEPFSALDAFTRADLQDHLLDLWADGRPTLVVVTHDVDEAIVLADRIVVMQPRPGRISEEIAVDLPRPRDRQSAPFDVAKRRVLAALDRSLDRAAEPADAGQRAAAGGALWW